MLSRRSFIAAGSLAVLGSGCSTCKTCAREEIVPAKPRTDGAYTLGNVKFKLGIAGYTYHRFNLDQTLDALRKLDVHYLCVKDFHLPISSTPSQIAEFKTKCADAGVTGYAVGPIYMEEGKRDAVKKAFDYAKELGVKTVVCVPYEWREINGKRERYESRSLCEYLSGLCKEYDMNCAIHNHGPDIPYLFPVAESIWNMVKDLDKRMGMCFDIGHQFRDNRDPVAAIYKYHSRIFDVHLKNVSDNSRKGGAMPLPRGKMNLVEVVRALRAVDYSGCCALEYERNFADNYAEIAECIGYFRGLMDSVS